ncbi:hypothetical protein DFJ73DRAFT_859593 [Zopfochytrium polystomum]|nr:hypothetical protein DFJ73DRAFT_859593 [Zopfochytrium polystomum]
MGLFWDAFCHLCGVSITTTCSPFHEAARGLLKSGLWSKAGRDSLEGGGIVPFHGDEEADTDEDLPERGDPDPDPDRSPNCWYRMEGDNAYFRLGLRNPDGDPAFPFHAACAKWLDAAFTRRGLSMDSLWSALMQGHEFDVSGTCIWRGALAKRCPDDANILQTQFKYPRIAGRHAFALARFDTLKWIDEIVARDCTKEPLVDWTAVPQDQVPMKDDFFDMYDPIHLVRLKRGCYEGSLRVYSSPTLTLPSLADDDALQCPHFAKRGPNRDMSGVDFDAPPIEDWKRVYFCYESRNWRRIAGAVAFLVDVIDKWEKASEEGRWWPGKPFPE